MLAARAISRRSLSETLSESLDICVRQLLLALRAHQSQDAYGPDFPYTVMCVSCEEGWWFVKKRSGGHAGLGDRPRDGAGRPRYEP